MQRKHLVLDSAYESNAESFDDFSIETYESILQRANSMNHAEGRFLDKETRILLQGLRRFKSRSGGLDDDQE